MSDFKVKLFPINEIVSVNAEESLFVQLKEQGYNIKSSCGGCASCALCVVKVMSGEENLSEIDFEEKQVLGNVFHMTRERLSCQTYVRGDVEIDISDHVSLPIKKEEKSVLVRKKADVEQMVQERKEKRAEKNQKKTKSGGMKRPRSFNYNEDTEE